METVNQDKYASMVDWMGKDWKSRFQPIEEGLLDEILNRDKNTRENVEAAGAVADKSYSATMGMSDRNLSRYGVEQSADQKSALASSNLRAAQAAKIGAMGVARDSATARYDQLQNGLMSVGTGVKGTALSGMGQAASMEAQRNGQNQQAYGQSQANTWNTVAQVAGIGTALAMTSDKNTKTNVRKASKKKALNDVESVDLKKFDYKKGQGGGREDKGHIGGMAQDMPDSMTSSDHKKVEIGDSIMNLVGATQALSDKIKKLEKRNGR